MKILTVFLLAITIASTALAGFDDIEIKANIKGDYVIGVMVSDQRETVLKWGAAENLIGAHHSGLFKNRKDLFTDTKATVSNELTEGLRKQFLKNWMSVAPILTTPKDSRDALDEKVRKARLHRTFLITLKSLWVEAQNNNQTAVNYGFVISVLDDKGVELSKKPLEGIQSTGQWGSWGAAEVFGMLISNVLEDPKVVEALVK